MSDKTGYYYDYHSSKYFRWEKEKLNADEGIDIE